MSEENKKQVSESVASILEEFRQSQRGATSSATNNFQLFDQRCFGEETLSAVRTRLTFDSSRYDTSITDIDIGSQTSAAALNSPNTNKEPEPLPNKSMKRIMETPLTLPQANKRFVMSTEGSIDWSPASKAQRNNLLDAMDSKINNLHKIVTNCEELKKEFIGAMDRDKLNFQRQKEKDQQMIKQLKEQVQNVKDEKFELEQKLIQSKGKYRELRNETDQQIQLLQSEKSQLELNFSELRSEYRGVRAQLNAELEQYQQELQLVSSQVDDQAARMAEMEEQLTCLRGREIKEEALQDSLKVAEARIRQLESQLQLCRETAHRREVPSPISATARRVKELEEQLTQSRSMLRGKLLLEETIASQSIQIAASAKLSEEHATLQELSKRKEEELKEWHSLACQLVSGESGELPSPRVVSGRLQQLEQAHLVLKNDLAKAMSQLSGTTQKSSVADAELRAEQSRSRSLQSSVESQANLMRKMERKLQLITKERDSIQSVLAAYEGDMTMVGNQLQQLQRQRMESAEQSARELRAMVEALEKELAQFRGTGTCSEPMGELAKLQEKLLETQKKLEIELAQRKTLEEKVDSLEMLLEQRALRGDYDPAQTKVLHFRMNPSAQEDSRRSAELAQLRQSNDKLRERVRVLESAMASGSSTLNTTAVVDEQLEIKSNKELMELREKSKQLETKNQRLVEAFKKTSQNFRQAVYLLFGYKTDLLSDNNFRLASMYAEHEEDILIFKILEGDTIEIMQTPFSDSIPELIKTHLDEQGSVPAFLSALTLDLFSRQTFTS